MNGVPTDGKARVFESSEYRTSDLTVIVTCLLSKGIQYSINFFVEIEFEYWIYRRSRFFHSKATSTFTISVPIVLDISCTATHYS